MLSVSYEVFYAVACHLSFSKAAEVLCISQPAVSKQIKKLESLIEVPLFERQGNAIALTPQGEKMLTYLREAKLIQNRMEADVEIIKSQMTAKAELKIGASTTLSLYVLPRVLSSFRKKWPLVKITLINRNTENVLKALKAHEIDLAVVEDKQESNALHYEFFMNDRIVPVCSARSPFAGREVSMDEFKAAPLAMREIGSGTLSAWSRTMSKWNIKASDLNIKVRLGGTEVLKNFLIEDDSIGFLSPLAIKREVALGLLQEVNIPGLLIERSFNFVTRTGESLTDTTRAFIREAKSIYN
ncbi:LysR substrate-binding domain-containing protein [Roseivirga thermotolerans]|uniref:LysR substrate-binding domain-containing protein n=1 Tax=Roseivirga thermotolerans TaxID=1758176 RepID=UPI00273EAC3F|nr:LysR substrate-binding domain-containing protein [Roseivirga thermotolerans]MEC7754573.1 LysR substrate-binding domain-containing protein [Bacteroidota bacterium]